MDFAELATDLLRAVRGKRSQRLLAHKLGYRTNVLHRWEAAQRSPTPGEFFRLAELVGIDVGAAFTRFSRTAAPSGCELRAGRVSEFLRALAGTQSIAALASASGHSRFVISRILAGVTEPRLPLFLELIELTCGRALDWVSCFVDPEKLPSAASEWARLQAYRRLAYDHPHSEAVLALLELREHAKLRTHTRGWIAKRLHIDVDEEDRTLEALSAAGLISWQAKRWRVNDEERFVDTRADPAAFARLKRFWSRRSAELYERNDEDLCAYVVFSASQRDVDTVADVLREAFEQGRRVVRSSKPTERAILAVVQLTSLDGRRVLSARSARSPARQLERDARALPR